MWKFLAGVRDWTELLVIILIWRDGVKMLASSLRIEQQWNTWHEEVRSERLKRLAQLAKARAAKAAKANDRKTEQARSDSGNTQEGEIPRV